MKDYYRKDDIKISEPCNTCIAKYWSVLCNRCKNCVHYDIRKNGEIDFKELEPPSGPVPI